MNKNEPRELIIYHEMTPPPNTCPVCHSAWKNYPVSMRPIALYSDFEKVGGCMYHYVEWMTYLQSQGYQIKGQETK